MSGISGIVSAVNLTDGVDEVNTIWVSINKNGGEQLVKCSPLNMGMRYIPVKGELVYLIQAATPFGSGGATTGVYYYLSPVGVHRNVNHNAFPGLTTLEGEVAPNYSNVSAGVPNSNSTSNQNNDFGNGFVEVTNSPSLQPFLGDTIFEGRYGQSIRFGYTPQGISVGNNSISAVSKSPTWSSTKPESPITIIRNGTTTAGGYNKFIVEDINKDVSSIWLTDQQKVNITLSSTLPLGITPATLWTKPQVILNSDRIVINSKKDNIILASKKDIVVTTAANTTTIDKIIEAITILAQGLYPTAVGPTGPHPQIAQIIAKLKQGI